MRNLNPAKKNEPLDEQTGLPAVRTWPRVYLLVAASFVLWVVLLYVLGQMFA